MDRSYSANPERNNSTDPLWFMNNDNCNVAPINPSSLIYDGRELSSAFDLLKISNPKDSTTANGHRRVSINGNNAVAYDWSNSQNILHRMEDTNLMRMRAQSAALGQIGFSDPHQNYLSSVRYNDLNQLRGNSSSNYGRSLNSEASMYNPHAYQNQMNSSLREQSCYSSCNWYPPNRLAYMPNSLRRRPNFYSFEDWRARILFLQKKLEQLNSEGIHVIFSEVKDYIRELMMDQLGSSLIQSFFENCNEEQMNRLLVLVFYDQRVLVDICTDTHGTGSMQKLLKNLTTGGQRLLVLSALRHLTISFSKSLSGCHVIQHCLKHFPSEETTQIQSVLAERCLEFASDKNGCYVVQVCAEYTRGSERDKILAQVAESAVFLSEHPYGNYVVSKLVRLRIPHVTKAILAKLAGNYATLAMNKHASNVVETCLRETQCNQPLQIIQEIIDSPYFLTVLQDPYGNFVAQRALDISEGNIMYGNLKRRILDHFPALQSHLYGKRVLARAAESMGRRRRV